MKKLIQGIVNFRKKNRDKYIKEHKDLVQGQNPDALFIACSDSRVVPNLFASTDPGDLFVHRNVGNIVPKDVEVNKGSVLATLEYAIHVLKVKDIIVCGHSQCGAMQALMEPQSVEALPGVSHWIAQIDRAEVLEKAKAINYPEVSEWNKVSLANTLVQREQLLSLQLVDQFVQQGQLKVHAWWFELENANVYAFDVENQHFQILEGEFAQIYSIKSHNPKGCC